MAVVNSVEQYLWYEVVATLEVVIDFVRGEKRQKMNWKGQLGKLKKAFDLFMLDLDVEDFKSLKVFKDLKLPSEHKSTPKKKTESRTNSRAKTKGLKTGKQLQLFFVKTMKFGLLKTLEGVELVTKSLTNIMFGDAPDFENKARSDRR
jgi:hypothetical protein